jgi:protein TonB
MFETYLVHQEVDPKIRRRFTFALSAAVVATVASGVMLWTVEKMHISRVGAPTSDFLIFALDEFVPPPQEPPPLLAGGETEDQDDVEEDPPEDILEEPTQPQETPNEIPKAKSSAKDVLARAGAGAGSPFGVPGGDPNSTCIVGCGRGVATPTTDGGDKKPPPEVDFSALTCRVCPDPDQKALQRTGAGLMNRRALSNKTRFCVESDGKVSSVSVRRSSGDKDVDRIIKQTVARWRFAPMMVGGRARKACSTASFDIRFE